MAATGRAARSIARPVDAAAAARRAERKRQRLAAPPPRRDAAFDTYALADLRTMRQTIAEEETRVSYWRRIIQARLDLLRAGIGSHDPVTDLRTALTDAQGSHRRLAHVSVEAVEGLPPMDDLAELWSRIIDPDDEVAVRQLAAEMTDAEHRLSTYRSELFRRQDAVTAELIARYRENPILALTALPTEPE